MPQKPFSLIADFNGDFAELLGKEVEGTFPILPLRNMVLFPGVVTTISVGRESSLRLLQDIVKKGEDALFAVSCQIDVQTSTPSLNDLYPTGVLAKIVRLIELPDQTTSAIVQAFGRVRISDHPTRITPYLRAMIQTIPETLPDRNDSEFQILYNTFRETTLKFLKVNSDLGPEALFSVQHISDPIFFINFVATNLPFNIEDKALLLEEDDFKARTLQLLKIVQRELQLTEIKNTIEQKTRAELDQQQREYFLHQTIKNIQSELGENENGELATLRERSNSLPLPDNVRNIFDRELSKTERIPPQVSEYHVSVNYLETLLSLPWGKSTTDKFDLKRVRRILDHDHFGMERVKERILEHLALQKVSRHHRPAILCLYGPPGVGKTSLCRSIAESLGRKYVRMSLGGLHDESEIRGHRRTYIAAMCGRVMKSLIKAESNNPVFVLDEIDKVGGSSHNGDPQSALLELLDPEQNNAFHDNYLDFDYDLSQVMFIATANTLSTIPGPLRDRMELINVEGYLMEEKKEILRKFLLPNAIKDLEIPFNLRLTSAATEFLIEKYTRESGVRQLNQQVAKLVRRMLLQLQTASTEDAPFEGDTPLRPNEVRTLLGTPPYQRDAYQGNDFAGVVTGLAWTAVGGEILFIECSVSRAKSPRLVITGNLGDVMKESALLAFEYVKSHADILCIDYRIFDHWNIHIHVPEGATPKDGPSAGITLATALASVFTQRKVHPHLAMTGEITLRGRVLPVGGIKEKILAAKRAGIAEIILSEDNRKDIEDIPERYVRGITFHFVQTIQEVWSLALLDEQVSDAIDLTLPLNSNDPLT